MPAIASPLRFRNQAIAALAAAGILPVLLLGLLSYRANRAELGAVGGAAQLRTAQQLATRAEEATLDALRSLELAARYLPFDQLSPQEAGAALQIPVRQLPELSALVLLDASGDALAPPVTREGAGESPELEAFARRLPRAATLATGRAAGEPYAAGGGLRVALAVRLGAERGVLAAELSLAHAAEHIARAAEGGDAAALFGPGGEPVATWGWTAAAPALADALAPGARTAEAGGEEWVVTSARSPILGWSVALARPGEAAFGPARRVRRYTVFWVSAAGLLAVGLGLLLGRGLARPVADLSKSAGALAAGRYDRSADEGAGGELGDLARSFNHMAREVQRRDEAIRAWNADLSARVERQTEELRAAELQVARSRHLAAVGALGAGVAHRINNPLAAMVGLVALTREAIGADTAEGKRLGEALQEARRVSAVVEQLRGMVEREVGEAGRPFALPATAEAALASRRPRAAEREVALELRAPAGLPLAVGDPAAIQLAVGHLLDNAIEASPRGGKVELTVTALDGAALRLCVADAGPGIPLADRQRVFDPLFGTKGQAGMGLTTCHRIVEAHHGTIRVDGEPGAGARVAIFLPAAPAAAHLD